MLKEKILQSLNSAFKEKKELEVSVLRQLSATFLNREKEKRFKIGKEKEGISEEDLSKQSTLSDEEVLEAISYEAKKRKEAIIGFEKGGRAESAEKEKKELAILEGFMPEQMSEEDIRKLVQEAIDKTGAKESKDMGKVMAELMPKTKGKADGALVSRIVKESLVS